MEKIDLLKSHVAAYTRKDGAFVAAHDDKRVAKQDADGLSGDVSLDHPAYNTPQKLKGYTSKVGITPHQATSARDAANVIIRNNPKWTKEDHKRLADAHQKAAEAHHDKWSEVADEAAQKTWGRKFAFGDYRISGIASDEFSAEHKDKLRTHAHSAGKHETLAAAHRAAASSRLTS